METVNSLELTVDRNQVRTILQALLYTIFFHRQLDNIEPETYESLGTHVTRAPSPSLQKEVSSKIESFCQTYLETGAEYGQIAVVFLQRVPKKGWFAVTEELVPWEEHLITLHITSRQPATALPKALLTLLQYCTEHKGNVPPLVGASEQNNLSYQILISPPPPSELFQPSPPQSALPSPPTISESSSDQTATGRRASSIPPSPIALSPSTTAPNTYTTASAGTGTGTGNSTGTGPLGYLEQAKGGLLAVGAKAGAGVGWGGRAVGAALGRRGE